MTFLAWFLISYLQPQKTPYPQDCLAPHPLYFTVDGSPSKTEAWAKGQKYDVWWDGLTVQMKTPEPNWEFIRKMRQHFLKLKQIHESETVIHYRGEIKVVKTRDLMRHLIEILAEERVMEETQKHRKLLVRYVLLFVILGLIAAIGIYLSLK